MPRPFVRHLDSEELDALVPSLEASSPSRFSVDWLREARSHADTCPDCSRGLANYRQLLERSSLRQSGGPATECPNDVDWLDVVLGLWPEGKAAQLMMHAARCERCGPLLHAATRMNAEATPAEETLIAALRAPSMPRSASSGFMDVVARVFKMRWPVPVASFVAIALVLVSLTLVSRRPLSGESFAAFAVDTHRQIVQGRLALDVHSDSQQMLNQWFRANAPFPLDLPASPPTPGEQRPYRLEGARLVQVRGRSAAVIAYRVQSLPQQTLAASLTVVPDSIAIASGGIEADFTKVRFHYATIEGYKVVTWSLHGLTYALVSEESNDTQRSCMLCHYTMKDRDLSTVPTPMSSKMRSIQPVWQ